MKPVLRPIAVRLRKNLARSIRQGHPWLYRDALEAQALDDGRLVEVQTKDGRPLATGFWDARSPIAVRMLTSPPAPDAHALVDTRLRESLELRLARLDRRTTNSFRWVHGEGDRLPGIHVDLYDDVATIRLDGDGARAFYGDLAGRLARAAAAASPPLRLRAVLDRAARTPSAALPDELEVRENGLLFGVDLLHGQKGGLFLDQRENRAAIGARARGLSVLNLFGYTGGFSVYAAAGGARRTDTVDLARPAIQAAERNFVRNRLDLTQAGFHAVDAFDFLAQAVRAGTRWDVVISDPPSFAPRKSALEAARRAYRRLHKMAAAVTAPGGLFCPASCSSHFPRSEFVASVEEGLQAAGRRGTIQALSGAGFDHPVLSSFPEGHYLKFALVRLD